MKRFFKIRATSKKSQARVTRLRTLHGTIDGPFFLPIATKGVVKTLSSGEMEKLGAQIILANAYHLYLQPGVQLLKKFGGLHGMMGWKGALLTDSGGYQVFSLGERENKLSARGGPAMGGQIINDTLQTKQFVKITEKGVEFRSYIDGSKHLFTPVKVQQIQEVIGSDIKMVLDVCPPYSATREKVEEAVRLTSKWAKEALAYHQKIRSKKLLFGIVQGGVHVDLREQSVRELVAMDFAGYAVGGLAVGEPAKMMYQVLDRIVPLLSEDRPRYLMGVGTPENIVQAVRRGIDMFDCVIPTREARHGRLYKFKSQKSKVSARGGSALGGKSLEGSFYEVIRVTNAKYRGDKKPIDAHCTCELCQKYSAGYLYHLFKTGEPLALRLATLHNVMFYLTLMWKLRLAIVEGYL